MDGEIELTVLMPCLNEAETLERCITKAMSALAAEAVSGEILSRTTAAPMVRRTSPGGSAPAW